MNNKINIAVDAMGGENAPKKILDGIEHFINNKNDIYFNIFGNKSVIEKNMPNKISKNFYNIIHTDETVKDEDSALTGAKNKNTSMWLAVDSVKSKKSDKIKNMTYINPLHILYGENYHYQEFN